MSDGRYIRSAKLVQISTMLVQLAADAQSTSQIRRSVDDTFSEVWSSVRESAADMPSTALLMYKQTVDDGFDIRCRSQMLVHIGTRTAQARDLKQWFAILCLVPGVADRIDSEETEHVPIEWLQEGAVIVYDALRSKEPDYIHIGHLVSFLHAAIGDVFALMKRLGEGGKSRVDSVRSIILDCKNQIRESLRFWCQTLTTQELAHCPAGTPVPFSSSPNWIICRSILSAWRRQQCDTNSEPRPRVGAGWR